MARPIAEEKTGTIQFGNSLLGCSSISFESTSMARPSVEERTGIIQFGNSPLRCSSILFVRFSTERTGTIQFDISPLGCSQRSPLSCPIVKNSEVLKGYLYNRWINMMVSITKGNVLLVSLSQNFKNEEQVQFSLILVCQAILKNLQQ